MDRVKKFVILLIVLCILGGIFAYASMKVRLCILTMIALAVFAWVKWVKRRKSRQHSEVERMRAEALDDGKKSKKDLEARAEKGEFFAIKTLIEEDYGQNWQALQKNDALAIELISKAAKLSEAKAAYILGKEYFYGSSNFFDHGLPRDIKKGIELITKAAKLDDPDANYWLGRQYDNDSYGTSNRNALTYYKKAKALGSIEASNRIYELEHRPDLTLTAAQLIRDYDENEIAADRKYKGKTVRVESGVVSAIGKDARGNVYVTFFGSELIGVICFFDKNHIKDVDALKKRNEVTVQGKLEGLVGKDVMIRHCWVVSY